MISEFFLNTLDYATGYLKTPKFSVTCTILTVSRDDAGVGWFEYSGRGIIDTVVFEF